MFSREEIAYLESQYVMRLGTVGPYVAIAMNTPSPIHSKKRLA